MSVSKRLRFEVMRRDNHACRYCGATAPDAKLTIDHVVPLALGGEDVPENLVTACSDCNSGKSSTTPDAPIVADVAQDALRWGRAMEAARLVAEREQDVRDAFCAEFREQWMSWEFGGGFNKPTWTVPLPGDWHATVAQFGSDGLTFREVRDAVDITLAHPRKDDFGYFCGVARNKIRERQAAARALIDGGMV